MFIPRSDQVSNTIINALVHAVFHAAEEVAFRRDRAAAEWDFPRRVCRNTFMGAPRRL